MDLALASRLEAVLNAHVAYLIAADWVRGDTGWKRRGETREIPQEDAVLAQLAIDRAALQTMQASTGALPQATLRRMPPTAIIRFVARHFHITAEQVTGRDRHEDIALARHIAMYLIRTVQRLSLTRIGRLFGNRDHTSVLAAVNKIDAQRFTCREVGEHVARLVLLDGPGARA